MKNFTFSVGSDSYNFSGKLVAFDGDYSIYDGQANGQNMLVRVLEK